MSGRVTSVLVLPSVLVGAAAYTGLAEAFGSIGVVAEVLFLAYVWALFGVPALLTALLSGRGKRLGDLVAGTYVVRDRVRLHLPWPATMPPPLAGWAARADIGRSTT